MSSIEFPEFTAGQQDPDPEHVQRICDLTCDPDILGKLRQVRESLSAFIQVSALALLEQAAADAEYRSTAVLSVLTESIRDLNARAEQAKESIARFGRRERDIGCERMAIACAAADLRSELTLRAARLRSDISTSQERRRDNQTAARKMGIGNAALDQVEPTDATVKLLGAQLRVIDEQLRKLDEYFERPAHARDTSTIADIDPSMARRMNEHLARLTAPLPAWPGPHEFRRPAFDPSQDVREMGLASVPKG
ncbi:hypothetical protein [Burkholderia sp. Ac-20353]|uniref:hypothetical protein n=1 Tax=Burkholderia sp. Ac-20353 TaxID=2703894 RepID=UPI00197C1788|nr:hypothetical protein [Burkholderia sp. Ac-20353]MBN3789305.1 hypothetical protein [Burkholderia sp. Ac-20353]